MSKKKKYYAVRLGHKPGIYETWEACLLNTKGYKGAVYKSFTEKSEAVEWLENGIAQSEMEMPEDRLIAYVDGSYSKKVPYKYGIGVAFIRSGKVLREYSSYGSEDSLLPMKNIAGEIEAARYAMMIAVDSHNTHLEIVHDYEGVGRWATGEWSTDKEGVQAYIDYYNSIKDRLVVKFTKVKGHSDDEYNDLADKLAKDGIGI